MSETLTSEMRPKGVFCTRCGRRCACTVQTTAEGVFELWRCPVSHGRQGTDGNLMARIRIGDAPAAEAPAQPPAAEVKTGRQRIAEARRKKALPGKR